MSKQEWGSIQDAMIGAGTLVHTDGAAAYRSCKPGVEHDWVNHRGNSKKKKAQYTKTVVHKKPGGKNIITKAGTQSLALSHLAIQMQSLVGMRRFCDNRLHSIRLFH